MFSLLDRYVLSELMRVLLLTTVVLVAVIAFGAAVRPLAEQLLSPASTVAYIVFAAVPMLQYALPFAAGFAATLVLNRLASENEILAMSVSGLSYRRLFMPLAGLGIVLTITMLILTLAIIPRFWGLMTSTFSDDVTRLFVTTVSRGEAFKLDNWQIYADSVDDVPAEGEQTRLVLQGVVAVETDERGVNREITGQYAVLDIYRRNGLTFLQLVVRNTTVFEPRNGTFISVEEIRPRLQPVADPIRTNTKFMTLGQLWSLRENKENFSQIQEKRLPLATALQELQLKDAIDTQLEQVGLVRLSHPDQKRTYELSGESATSQNTRIIQYRDGLPEYEILASSMRLEPASNSFTGAVSFDLFVEPSQITDLQTGQTSESNRMLSVTGLSPDTKAAQQFNISAMSSNELLNEVASMPQQNERLKRLSSRLREEIVEVGWEINARLQQRTALSLSAFLLLMLGATMAIWLRRSLPLTVYVWAFLPAIAAILLISSGEQMVKGGRGVIGSATLWSGDALLTVILIWVYARLRRH